MPYSNVEQITPIMTEVLRIRPRRLIDIGCGLGVYGFLSRIQLDLYFNEQFYKKLFREFRSDAIEWETVIDAIEGFEDYIDFIPQWVYNSIIVEDVRTALPKIPDNAYEMALALAVIEHLDKAEGTEFIRHLKRISRIVILSVPKNVLPQAVPGNDFETHRSKWSKQDFIDLGFNKFLAHSGAWIPVFDPDLPHYGESMDNPADSSLRDVLAQKLDTLTTQVDQALALQAAAVNPFGIKYRLKALFGRLGLAK